MKKCHLKKVSGRLKVKVTLEGQMIKWSYIGLVWDITSSFMHRFLNNLAFWGVSVTFETFVRED